MFLMLGIIYAVFGIIATILISEPEESQSEIMSLKSEESDSEAVKSEEIREEPRSYSPLEVLKTATFYQVRAYLNLLTVKINF